MAYSVVLFDLDHTLLDSAASERIAFAETLRAAGVTDPGEYFARYVAINRALWCDVERDLITPNDLRVSRWIEFVEATAIDADPELLANDYVRGLGANGELYPGARATLNRLHTRVRMALVTNGIGEVQRSRISRLGIARYFEFIAISGEVGTSKPGSEIFDITFAGLGWPDKSDVLMVGDSLSSDIRGGERYGVATCWINSTAATRGDRVSGATHTIRDLGELPNLVTARDTI